MKKIPTHVSYIINTVLIALLLSVGHLVMRGKADGQMLSSLSGGLSRAQMSVILQSGIYMIMAVSLNISTGYLGQLPLGHAGFMAVGGYAAALFWKSGVFVPGMSTPMTILMFAAGILIAGITAAVFGIMIGIPALRLKGDYLAIITLGFGEIIRVVITNLSDITGGAAGLKRIPKSADLVQNSSFLLVYICLALTCIAIHTMMKSRHGRAILSIRGNEIAAESCGINTTYYKVMAFAFSAFFAGVAGALYATNQAILVPKNFGFMDSINILVMVVLGGMGSMLGSMISAAILTALPLAMQSFNEYRMIIYPILLILVMIFKPSGLMGNYDFSLSRILEKVLKKTKTGGGA